MDPRWESVVRRLLPDLVNIWRPQLDHLYSAYLVTIEEYQSLGTLLPFDQCKKLLIEILPRKGPKAYETFLEVLSKTEGQEFIAEMLENAAGKRIEAEVATSVSSTEESDSLTRPPRESTSMIFGRIPTTEKVAFGSSSAASSAVQRVNSESFSSGNGEEIALPRNVARDAPRNQITPQTSVYAYTDIRQEELDYNDAGGDDDLIGTGGFSEVYKAWFTRLGEKVAVKVFTYLKRRRTQTESDLLNKEVKILQGIKPHPNIITLIGSCSDTRFFALVTEYMEGGNVFELIADMSDPNVEIWENRQDIALQIAQGMNHLHCNDPSVIHLDLKLRNVLYRRVGARGTAEFSCKLCDFGLAKMAEISSVTKERDESNYPSGTPAHIAPESYGVILWEIQERRPLLENEHVVMKHTFSVLCKILLIDLRLVISLPHFPENRQERNFYADAINCKHYGSARERIEEPEDEITTTLRRTRRTAKEGILIILMMDDPKCMEGISWSCVFPFLSLD
ncbi:uncharacterized protein [Oscarella lobularis]|uniref:uncharacterized protein isoform X2 n=1 Tax=Oscarella lobularis TaxID=121494 RepID=UPI0033140688